MWSIKITGPDADDLMWLDLSDPERGSVPFGAPADSVRGDILKQAREDGLGVQNVGA
jgi:hypothetical protein